MNKLSLLGVLLRERFSARQLQRKPEPLLVMDDAEQVAAYDEAGSIDGLMASAYLFHSARASLVLAGCKRVIDVGCGSAVQLCQIAQLNPDIEFIGVDLSPTMLEKAHDNAKGLAAANLSFVQGDMTDLGFLPDHSVDGVISTMALHHLQTVDDLHRCFREIKRVLVKGGSFYLVDFGRLKLEATLRFFASQNVDVQPPLFVEDYENSLMAAFEFDDFRRASAELPADAQVISTFMVPMLTVVKSRDKQLTQTKHETLRGMASRLPARYRRDFNDIRTFFRLGGLVNDPFR